MMGITTVTQKGQITIPISMRNMLGWTPLSQVQIRMGDGGVVVESLEDLLDLANKYNLKAPKSKNAIKARKWMGKHYFRG